MKCMEKGVEIVNLPGLIKGKMEERDAITLYNSVKHLFFSHQKIKKSIDTKACHGRRSITFYLRGNFDCLVNRRVEHKPIFVVM